MKGYIVNIDGVNRITEVRLSRKSAVNLAIGKGPFYKDSDRQVACAFIEGTTRSAFFFTKVPVPCDVYPNAYATDYVTIKEVEVNP